jgi:hypothetical protein
VTLTSGHQECEWCGEPHDQKALCTKAPGRLTRRSFIFLAGAGAVGLALVGPQGAAASPYRVPGAKYDFVKLGDVILKAQMWGVTPETVRVGKIAGVNLAEAPVVAWDGRTLRTRDEDLGAHRERTLLGSRGDGQSMGGKSWPNEQEMRYGRDWEVVHTDPTGRTGAHYLRRKRR